MRNEIDRTGEKEAKGWMPENRAGRASDKLPVRSIASLDLRGPLFRGETAN